MITQDEINNILLPLKVQSSAEPNHEIKTISWCESSYPYPILNDVIRDYDGMKWRVINRSVKPGNIRITLKKFSKY
jgi:hypothetical protein